MTVLERTDRLVELAADLRSGALSPGDYLAHLSTRFSEREADVRAFLPEDGRLERLLYQATMLAETYPDVDSRPPLFGVPIGVKDIFHIDGFETRAGSRLPPDALAGPQSAAVSALVAAGGLVLGKTVTTEFAWFAPGPTRNPIDLERTPGGSSSGSAAAVGAGLAPLALGTQTIGSVGRPASYCGVVGFKPSYGRIPTAGVVPLSPSLDHVGLFTRDARGARLAAGLLCESWERREDERPTPKLAVPEGPYLSHATDEAMAGFRDCVERLRRAGFSIAPVPAFEAFDEVDRRHRLLVAAEAARVHADWYDDFSKLYADQTVELIEQGMEVSDAKLTELRAGRARLRVELESLMDEHGVDLWLSPAAQGPAPRGLDSTGNPVMNLPWTYAGLPTISLPAWRVGELPMGLQVAGRFGADEPLLDDAVRLEEALGG